MPTGITEYSIQSTLCRQAHFNSTADSCVVTAVALKSIKTEKRRLADEVYDQLLESIVAGELGPDDRLVQERLAAELDISRTPVREALLRLEQEGVLVSAARGGFKLYKMSESEVRQCYQARAAIEGQAARILASKNEPAINKQLRQTITSEEAIAEQSVRAYFEANRNIHRKFVELIDNTYLIEMYDNIWNRAASYQLFASIENVDLSNSLGEHMKLVDAIETGDRSVALETYIEHIEDGFALQMSGLNSTE